MADSSQYYYMGVDVGSGSARVCLIDDTGTIRSVEYQGT